MRGMPKRELSKCREWERERRDRLKTCFDSLARLLPSHDPTITTSKLEILQRASAHITDLQQKNKDLLLGDQKCTSIAQRDEVRRLRDRVKKLSTRSEQLANLLKSAGLKIPKECLGRPQNTIGGQGPLFKGPPKLWSGRVSREKAEILQKQHEIGKAPLETSGKPSLKRKRKRSPNKKPPNLGENTPPTKKPLKNSSTSGCAPKHPSNTSKSSKKQLGGPTNFSTSPNFANKVATVLGPGTLILANGAVVPVPGTLGPKATLHRIQLLPTVPQNNSQVILMKNVGNENKFPIIRPKIPGNLRRNVIQAKIAIPSLPRRKICAKKNKNICKTPIKTVNEPIINSTTVITTNTIKETDKKNLVDNKNSTETFPVKSEVLPVKSSENINKNEQNLAKNDSKLKIDDLAPENSNKNDKKLQEINSSPNNTKNNSAVSQNISKVSPKPQNIDHPLNNHTSHSDHSPNNHISRNDHIAHTSNSDPLQNNHTSHSDHSQHNHISRSDHPQNNHTSRSDHIAHTSNSDHPQNNHISRSDHPQNIHISQSDHPQNNHISRSDHIAHTSNNDHPQNNHTSHSDHTAHTAHTSHSDHNDHSDQNNYKNNQPPYKKPQNDPILQLPTENHPQSDPTPHEVIQSDQNHLQHPEDHSELSNDIFASLGGANDPSMGGQHTESMSPTAAFLLAFPLVSTLTGSRISDPHNTISGTGNSTNSLLNNNNGGGNNNNDRNEQNESPDRQSTPTTLLQIGTMNIDKNNSRTVLQIGDTINIDNNKNSRNILHQITDLGPVGQNKTILQQPEDENIKNSRSLDNFGYFRNQNYQNQPINPSNSCLNPRESSSAQNSGQNSGQNSQNSGQNSDQTISQNSGQNMGLNRGQNSGQNVSQNSQNIRNNRENFENIREPLISSVLQISHACLYEQRAPQQNANNFYPHAYSDIRNLSENGAQHSENPQNTQNSQNPQNTQNSLNVSLHGQNPGYNSCQTSSKDTSKTNNSSKRGTKQQNQRHLVNWMTTPDIRHNFSTNDPQISTTSSDYFLPPFSDVYSGISSAISSDLNQNNDPNFSWTSGANRNVLPTLLGDLALGVTSINNITTSNTSNSITYSNSTSHISKNIINSSNNNNNQCYHPFEPSGNQLSSQNHLQSSQHQNKENSGSFLSVSSILVGGKPRKHHGTQQNTKRHRDKTKQSRENSNSHSITSNASAMSSNANAMSSNANTMSSNIASSSGMNFMGPNKKYGGGYSAEELIGETQYQNLSNIPSYTLTNLGDTSSQQYHNRGGPIPQIHPQIPLQPPQIPIQPSQIPIQPPQLSTQPSQNQSHNLNQNPQNIQQIQHSSRHNNNQGYQNRQQAQQQQQGPFGANYPPLTPNHGEFSALLNAAVVDTYNKSFDSFVHVKPLPGPPNGAQVGHTPAGGFEGYCTTGRSDSGPPHHRLTLPLSGAAITDKGNSSWVIQQAPAGSVNSGPTDSDRRRHSRRSGTHTTSRDTQVQNGAHSNATNTGQSFSDLSFLSMSGAVSSPVLPDDFHASAPFLTNAPPPIPTPVASSLTNFNLSAIFPEINKGASVSSASAAPVWPHSKPPVPSGRVQTRYQNQQNNSHSHQHSAPSGGAKPYCHPQQHVHGQQGPHEGLYGGGAASQSFPAILGHQVQRENPESTTVPTNFSFNFATP